jgi:hypothetical protein
MTVVVLCAHSAFVQKGIDRVIAVWLTGGPTGDSKICRGSSDALGGVNSGHCGSSSVAEVCRMVDACVVLGVRRGSGAECGVGVGPEGSCRNCLGVTECVYFCSYLQLKSDVHVFAWGGVLLLVKHRP